jgi:hypothetical protein
MILSPNNLRLLLTLPATLTDVLGKIWFYSNADWKQYWARVTGALRITIPTTTVEDDTLEPVVLTDNTVVVNAVTYHLASFADIASMSTRARHLEENYTQMRAALKTAGWISCNDNVFDSVLGLETGQSLGLETGEEISLEH